MSCKIHDPGPSLVLLLLECQLGHCNAFSKIVLRLFVASIIKTTFSQLNYKLDEESINIRVLCDGRLKSVGGIWAKSSHIFLLDPCVLVFF